MLEALEGLDLELRLHAKSSGVAATLRGARPGRRVLLPVCGGNIDLMILSSVIQRGLARSHRLVRLAVEIPDLPGALGEICRLIGELDSNIVEVAHHRAFAGSSVRVTEVEFLLQMRGEEQADEVLARLAAEGYAARLAR